MCLGIFHQLSGRTRDAAALHIECADAHCVRHGLTSACESLHGHT